MDPFSTINMEAWSLFDLCRGRSAEGDPLPYLQAVLVRGVAGKIFLDHQNMARVGLEADGRGLRFVECKCLSNETISHIREGDSVALRGYYLGMEDSLTVALTLCELIDEGDRGVAAGGGVGAVDIDRCYLCGKLKREAHLMIPVKRGAICDQCAAHKIGKRISR